MWPKYSVIWTATVKDGGYDLGDSGSPAAIDIKLPVAAQAKRTPLPLVKADAVWLPAIPLTNIIRKKSI